MIDTQNDDDDDTRPSVEQSVLTGRPPALPDAKPGSKRKFWAYLAPECPLPSITIGGVAFHAEVEHHGEDGKVTSMPGQIVELSEQDLELLNEQLAEYVLRSYFAIDDKGRRIRRGQQMIALYRHERPGVGLDGGPLLDATKKPITDTKLVMNANARSSPHDEPLVKYCRLEPVSRETEAVFERLSARARSMAERIEEARRYNSEQVDRERTLAEEAGARGRSSVMAREP